jgi:hypothetical protein
MLYMLFQRYCALKLILSLAITYLSIAFFSVACTSDKLTPPSDLKIQLQYYYNAASPDQQSLESGLKWYFSYLGATLQKGQLANAIKWKRNTNHNALLEIDCSKLGFSLAAEDALKQIIQVIKNSPAYQENQYIDLGRFVALTLNSSNHYYAITGVYPSFNDFKNAYNFEDTAVISLNNGASSVTSGNRIIYQTKNAVTNFQQMAFIALEGTGDLQQGNFEASDFEVFDFMPNGQPRFAIYDEHGQLKTAVPMPLGEAGKPAKCIWCHESTIQPNFVLQHPQSTAFNQNINIKNTLLNTARNQFDSDLSYLLLQEHHFAELLYISFMEPTAERLAQEWNYTLTETQALLQTYTTHTHHEYPQLGNLYNRNDVDHLHPLPVLQTPESAHEASFYEPNF